MSTNGTSLWLCNTFRRKPYVTPRPEIANMKGEHPIRQYIFCFVMYFNWIDDTPSGKYRTKKKTKAKTK